MNNEMELSLEEMEKICGGISCYKQMNKAELNTYTGLVKLVRHYETGHEWDKATEAQQKLDEYTVYLEEKYKKH